MEPPDEPDHHALDLQLVLADEDRAHARVGGAQLDARAAAVVLLDGGVVADEGDDGLAVAGVALALDDDDVALADAVVDHAVADDLEGEVVVAAQQRVGDLDGLVCAYRLDRPAPRPGPGAARSSAPARGRPARWRACCCPRGCGCSPSPRA